MILIRSLVTKCSLALALAFSLGAQPVSAEAPELENAAAKARAMLRADGSNPFEAFRVIGNIYYVGATAISAHIIATSDGLILLDTGTREMSAGILANIEKLGFRQQDIKIILSSHAHWDHVEGHADMKRLTGARVMALGDDAIAIRTGIDSSAVDATDWEPVSVDRTLKDGEAVTLGGVTLRAHLTRGHTKGCTTWTMMVQEDSREHLVVFVGGTTVNPGVRLLGNTRHPGIEDDYARTFRTLKAIPADVFLAPHPHMHDMVEKRKRMEAGAAENPFIDPEGYQRFVRAEEAKFVAQIQRERVESRGSTASP